MTCRNVLLVTVDSLRFDSFCRLVDDGATCAARLVDDGVAFRRAFATGPGTTPSFPALLTGTLPLSHGGLGPLTDDRPRLSAALSDAGLATAGFQCNPFLSRYFDYDVGFDAFEDYQNPLMGLATRLFPRGIEINNPKLRRVDDRLHLTDAVKRAYQLVAGKPRPYVSADVVTDDAVAWLDGTDGPFLCWVHYMDVHHPCFPPERYRERQGVDDVARSEVAAWYSDFVSSPGDLDEAAVGQLRRLHRAGVEYTDDQVGRILDHLGETGRYEDTLVVLTSDHGELFGEHGHYGKPERMYDELLHVPLVVANGPDHLADAAGDLVSLLDVPPLVHDALEVDVPDAYEGRVPGRDEPRTVVLAEHEVEGDVVVGGRSADWRYEVDDVRDERRCFDLSGEEAEPVAPDAVRGDVVAAVERRYREVDPTAGAVADAATDDVAERLEDLGYL